MNIINTGYEHWEIVLDGKVVGNIRVFRGFGKGHKNLYLGEDEKVKISEIKNQREAVEKLENFFIENKKEIMRVEGLIRDLDIGLSQVEYEICKVALNKEKNLQLDTLNKLKSRDLI